MGLKVTTPKTTRNTEYCQTSKYQTEVLNELKGDSRSVCGCAVSPSHAVTLCPVSFRLEDVQPDAPRYNSQDETEHETFFSFPLFFSFSSNWGLWRLRCHLVNKNRTLPSLLETASCFMSAFVTDACKETVFFFQTLASSHKQLCSAVRSAAFKKQNKNCKYCINDLKSVYAPHLCANYVSCAI